MVAKKKTKKKKSGGYCTTAQAGRVLGKLSAQVKAAAKALRKRK